MRGDWKTYACIVFVITGNAAAVVVAVALPEHSGVSGWFGRGGAAMWFVLALSVLVAAWNIWLAIAESTNAFRIALGLSPFATLAVGLLGMGYLEATWVSPSHLADPKEEIAATLSVILESGLPAVYSLSAIGVLSLGTLWSISYRALSRTEGTAYLKTAHLLLPTVPAVFLGAAPGPCSFFSIPPSFCAGFATTAGAFVFAVGNLGLIAAALARAAKQGTPETSLLQIARDVVDCVPLAVLATFFALIGFVGMWHLVFETRAYDAAIAFLSYGDVSANVPYSTEYREGLLQTHRLKQFGIVVLSVGVFLATLLARKALKEEYSREERDE